MTKRTRRQLLAGAAGLLALGSVGDQTKQGVCMAARARSWGQPASLHQPPAPTPIPAPAYTFADEFNGPARSLPDTTKWLWDVGPGASIGGNNETENYVQSSNNSYLDGNGHLVIAATSDGAGGVNSARIKSNFHQLFGHWEASIAVPNVPGCWPAFWFLGQGQWPGCGECDVMENYGTGFAEGTIWNATATGNHHGRSTSTMDGGFHTYRMDWVKGSIDLYYDNTLYASATSVNLTPWPFDSNGGSYCILNIAVSGTGTGDVKPNAALLPAKMLVDYVHCWT
jgi:beta-glucanase (GH16 family)